MLGLGDIVIPGIFVALLLRYDYHNDYRTNYFARSPPPPPPADTPSALGMPGHARKAPGEGGGGRDSLAPATRPQISA